MKPPKDLERFEDAKMAAARLINLALERIMFAKAQVQWTIVLRYHQTPEQLASDEREVAVVRSTVSNKARGTASTPAERGTNAKRND